MGRIITSSDNNYSNNDSNNGNSKIGIAIIMVTKNLRVADNGFIISVDAPMHFRHFPPRKNALKFMYRDYFREEMCESGLSK